MAITINSNISSLRIQRSLSTNAVELGQSFERLSSGMRINRASDDAAGLSIADSLKAKGKIYNQGIRNLNDGISLISIADSAMSSLVDMTTRMKELAEQAANGTYSLKQRQAIDSEAQALSKEFQRIVKTTSFNGLNVFDGSVQGINLQAGTGTDGVISSSLGGSLGTGTFASAITTQTGAAPESTAIGDINGDGILDVAVGNRNDNNISIMIGKGDGTFTTVATLATGTSTLGVQLVDLNGDGYLDLLNTDLGSFTVGYRLNDGKGNFGARTSFATPDYPYGAGVEDINHDGNVDIAVGGMVYYGKGGGSFSSGVTGAAPHGTTTGDLNGDGIGDYTVVDYGNWDVEIYLGNSNGTFTQKATLYTGVAPIAAQIADFDNDGKMDLLELDSYFGTVELFRGNGDGTFQPSTGYAVSSQTRSMTIGDFNGDGSVDFAVGTPGNNTTSVFINNGKGSFSSGTTYQTAPGPLSTLAGDFNNDGVLDILSTNSGGNNITVLLGNKRDGIAPFQKFSLATSADARQAMGIFDTKFNLLITQRGVLGAYMSRIDTAKNVLQSSSENIQAAESRIRDVDVASESANLSRRSILQQAAVAILAQANQQPQIALKLLSVN